MRFALGSVLVLAFLAAAGDRENEQEIEAARKRVHEMLQKAEELKRKGAFEDAEHLLHKARDLQAKLDSIRKRDDGMHGVLEGLERGMEALRRLERFDEVERLEKIAAEVRRELEQREHRDRERAVGREQLEVMRMAFDGLMKGGRKDSADLMEHAMHALKLALEGRRDEEAIHIRESAPNRAQQAELLLLAAELLEQQGRREKAQAVARLGRTFQGKVQERDTVMHRVERLEERIAHLERTLDRLFAELRERDK